jgi:hypothetical protein
VSLATARLLAVALAVSAALQAQTASARADTAILGFTRAGAKAERTYEKRFQSLLSADVVRRTSRFLSLRPRPTGTVGSRRAFRYSVRRLRAYGLTVSTP